MQSHRPPLQRKKRAYAAIAAGKPSPDHAAKAAAASSAVEKAEKGLTQRREDLDRMTEVRLLLLRAYGVRAGGSHAGHAPTPAPPQVLKAEISRSNASRRKVFVARIAAHAQLQARYAEAVSFAHCGLCACRHGSHWALHCVPLHLFFSAA